MLITAEIFFLYIRSIAVFIHGYANENIYLIKIKNEKKYTSALSGWYDGIFWL